MSWRVVAGRIALITGCAVAPALAGAQAAPPPPPREGFTLAQTISDEAQRKTLAFSGLAMMTGNLEAQSFFPPGKVAPDRHAPQDAPGLEAVARQRANAGVGAVREVR